MKKFIVSFIACTSLFSLALAQCMHSILLTDTYGDGWNGGTITVRVNGVDVLSNITLTSGYGPQTFTFSATTGQSIQVIRTNAGSWPTEMRFEIMNPFCTTLLSSTQPTDSPGHTLSASCLSTAGEYTLVGNAYTNALGNCVILTEASNNQKGCSWDANSTLNFTTNFSYDLTVNLGANDGGADGLCFVIQNDSRGRCACGGDGGGMGAQGIANSLIVEIDTYLNSEDRDDGLPGVLCHGGPDPDHMDLWLNGNVNPNLDYDNCSTHAGERIIPTAQALLTSGGGNYNVENGLNHTLRISWNAATSTFSAALKDAIPGAHSYATVSYAFNPLTLFGTNTPFFGFTASTGGLNNEHSFCLPPVLLPIQLSDFSTHCSSNGVRINWTTLSELNNERFVIERSTDLETTLRIGEIAGAGNSSALLEYHFLDENAPAGMSYYRIKQIDIDGTESAYPWQAVDCSHLQENSVVFPNPAREKAWISLAPHFRGTHCTIELVGALGHLVHSDELSSHFQGNYMLDIQHWTKGVYYIKIANEQYTETLQFIQH